MFLCGFWFLTEGYLSQITFSHLCSKTLHFSQWQNHLKKASRKKTRAQYTNRETLTSRLQQHNKWHTTELWLQSYPAHTILDRKKTHVGTYGALLPNPSGSLLSMHEQGLLSAYLFIAKVFINSSVLQFFLVKKPLCPYQNHIYFLQSSVSLLWSKDWSIVWRRLWFLPAEKTVFFIVSSWRQLNNHGWNFIRSSLQRAYSIHPESEVQVLTADLGQSKEIHRIIELFRKKSNR